MDTDTELPDLTVTDKSVMTIYSVALTIENGPMVQGYGKSAFRAKYLRATWNRIGDEAWRFGSVQVSGPKPRKDGSDSQIMSKRGFYGRDQHPFVALLDAHGPDAR